jgi:hypothetical protein
MLVRNKRTGFVYAYSKVYAFDPDFEVYEEQITQEAAVDDQIDIKMAASALLKKRRPARERVQTDGINTEQPV